GAGSGSAPRRPPPPGGWCWRRGGSAPPPLVRGRPLRPRGASPARPSAPRGAAPRPRRSRRCGEGSTRSGSRPCAPPPAGSCAGSRERGTASSARRGGRPASWGTRAPRLLEARGPHHLRHVQGVVLVPALPASALRLGMPGVRLPRLQRLLVLEPGQRQALSILRLVTLVAEVTRVVLHQSLQLGVQGLVLRPCCGGEAGAE